MDTIGDALGFLLAIVGGLAVLPFAMDRLERTLRAPAASVTSVGDVTDEGPRLAPSRTDL